VRFRKSKKEYLPAKDRAKIVLFQIKSVLHCHFPDLRESLETLPDLRIGEEYRIEELVMAAIVLFLLRCDSRNEFNHKSSDKQFCKNYYKMFRLHVPGMDAVNNLFEKIIPDIFEQLRCHLISRLIDKRVFHKLRFFEDCFFCIAIDGTGFYNWGATPPESIRQFALKKESKKKAEKKTEKKAEKETEKKVEKESKKKAEREAENESEKGDEKGTEGGKVSYSTHVLEAVLVCSNGMVIPLISEWIANDDETNRKQDEEKRKQDCELNAFKRMAIKLKKHFPRLNICILADGLYSNVAMMDVCQENGWKFITVFKDGNLPSVWEEVELLLPVKRAVETCQTTPVDSNCWITCNYRWIKDIEYQKKYKIHWVECVRESENKKTGDKNTNRFVFITTLDVTLKNVENIVKAGRARWSIEDYFNGSTGSPTIRRRIGAERSTTSLTVITSTH
jgi:hypothetical protein